MSEQRNLRWGYKSTSALPRRTFVVNVEVVALSTAESTKSGYYALNVTAPDPLAAEGVARRYFSDDAGVVEFEVTLVREVSDAYVSDTSRRAPVVTVPHWFEHRLAR